MLNKINGAYMFKIETAKVVEKKCPYIHLPILALKHVKLKGLANKNI